MARVYEITREEYDGTTVTTYTDDHKLKTAVVRAMEDGELKTTKCLTIRSAFMGRTEAYYDKDLT